MTEKYKGYEIYYKNVQFVWKYQVSLKLVIWIERSTNSFILCGLLRGERGGGKRFMEKSTKLTQTFLSASPKV